MLSKRKLEERELRKQKILDGALKVFKIHGIEKTTMDEVAHESGFGKATLYYYYTSKDEVFIDIMVKGWKDLWEGIESRIVEEKSPKEKFLGIIKKILNLFYIVQLNQVTIGRQKNLLLILLLIHWVL